MTDAGRAPSSGSSSDGARVLDAAGEQPSPESVALQHAAAPPASSGAQDDTSALAPRATGGLPNAAASAAASPPVGNAPSAGGSQPRGDTPTAGDPRQAGAAQTPLDAPRSDVPRSDVPRSEGSAPPASTSSAGGSSAASGAPVAAGGEVSQANANAPAATQTHTSSQAEGAPQTPPGTSSAKAIQSAANAAARTPQRPGTTHTSKIATAPRDPAQAARMGAADQYSTLDGTATTLPGGLSAGAHDKLWVPEAATGTGTAGSLTGTPASAAATTSAAASASVVADAQDVAADLGTLDLGAGLQQAIETLHGTIELAARQGLAQARLALHPQALGAVRIHLTQTAQGLLARVSAETPAAAQALAAGHAELRQSLSALGIDLARLHVGHGEQLAAHSDGAPAGGSRQDARDHAGEARAAAGALDGIHRPNPSLPINSTHAEPAAGVPASPAHTLVDVLA